jgi:hypothetical protein
MGAQLQDAPQGLASERRAFERVGASFTGKLFVPAESTTLDCTVVDLSAGGAGVRCAEAPPLNTFVVLYVDGMGRFEAVTVRFVQGVLGLRFQCRDARRKRLIEKLNLYVNTGVTTVTRLRAHERVANVTALHFTRPNGEEVRCDVLDISQEGMSLRTNGRPPINELIQVGRTYGRVVRHHDQGIGIQFVVADSVRVFA